MNTPNPLDVAIAAARKAGDLIRAEYEKEQTIQKKSDNTLTTDTDKKAEAIIVQRIQDAFPEDAIFSEEMGIINGTADSLWIIDPLDGTSNFTQHIPCVAVSIARIHEGKTQLGVVYDPIHDKLFAAESESSATVNNQPLHTSTQTNPSESIVSFGRGSRNKKLLGPLFNDVNAAIRTPRILGSTALCICYVASGQHEAHINVDCYLYDCIAAAIIAAEAGATVLDFEGQPWQPRLDNPTSTSNIIVSNQALGKKLSQLINNK